MEGTVGATSEQPAKTVPLRVLAERVEHLRDAAKTHEINDGTRHGEVMDEIRELRKAGAQRGDLVLKAMQEQSQMVLRSAGLIVALLVVGLLGVVGVGVGFDLEGLGKVNVRHVPTASAATVEPLPDVPPGESEAH